MYPRSSVRSLDAFAVAAQEKYEFLFNYAEKVIFKLFSLTQRLLWQLLRAGPERQLQCGLDTSEESLFFWEKEESHLTRETWRVNSMGTCSFVKPTKSRKLFWKNRLINERNRQKTTFVIVRRFNFFLKYQLSDAFHENQLLALLSCPALFVTGPTNYCTS
jgi:hypothetical protein